jgi:Spy/CpxP family protein refolding chaperone
MRSNNLFALSITVLLLFVSTLSYAQPGPPHHKKGKKRGHAKMHKIMRHLYPVEMVMRHQGELNITDAQREKLMKASQESQKVYIEEKWAISATEAKMEQTLKEPKIDDAKAMTLLNELFKHEQAIKKARLQLMITVKNTLTAEQKKTLDTMKAERKMKRKSKHPRRDK